MLFLIGLLIVAGYVQAYNWGWSNGHDVHHDESVHGPNVIHNHETEEEPKNPLYK